MNRLSECEMDNWIMNQNCHGEAESQHLGRFIFAQVVENIGLQTNERKKNYPKPNVADINSRAE